MAAVPALVGIGALAPTGRAAAPSPTAGGITLTVSLDVYALQQYGTAAERSALYNNALEGFLAAHRGIEVHVVPFLPTAANQTAIIAGTAPDVFPDCCAYASYVDGGLLYPLDAYLKRDNVDLGVFSPRMVQWLRLPFGTFALSRASDAGAYAINLQVLDAAGIPHPTTDWSYSEFADLAAAVTQTSNDGKQKRWGFACINGGPAVLTEFFGGFGAHAVDAERSGQTWSTPAGVAAGEFWFDRFQYPGIGTSGFFTDGTAVIQNLDMNSLLHLYLGWRTAGISRWSLYPPPIYPQGRSTFLAGNFWGMSGTTRQPDAAWELMKWLAIEPAWQRFLTRTFLWPPAVNSLLADWVATVESVVPDLKGRGLSAFTAAAEHGWAHLRVVDDNTVIYDSAQANQIDFDLWTQLSARTLSVTEAFHQADQRVNALEASAVSAQAKQLATEAAIAQAAARGGPFSAPAVTGLGAPPSPPARGYFSTGPGGRYTLVGDGADVNSPSANCIWAGSAQRSAQATFTCRLTMLANVNCPHLSQWAKVGLMACSNLSDQAAAIAIEVTGGHGIVVQAQILPGVGWQSQTPSSAMAPTGLIGPGRLTLSNTRPATNYLLQPIWLRLVRSGLAWTAYTSFDGRSWTQAGTTVGVEMGGAWVGLFATAHNMSFGGKGLIRGQFDQVSFPVTSAYQIGAP
jgi:ABC-type glycerol-3-phosphate transport system substrate-binding protein